MPATRSSSIFAEIPRSPLRLRQHENHFEIQLGKPRLGRRRIVSRSAGEFEEAGGPMNYGIVQPDGNTNGDGVGIEARRQAADGTGSGFGD